MQPALFIPREEIKAMELARAGGTSSTFDVFVHRKDGRVEEFGMLPREETGPLECRPGGSGVRGLMPYGAIHWHGSRCSQQAPADVTASAPCPVAAAYMMKQKLRPPADDSDASEGSEASSGDGSSSDAEVGRRRGSPRSMRLRRSISSHPHGPHLPRTSVSAVLVCAGTGRDFRPRGRVERRGRKARWPQAVWRLRCRYGSCFARAICRHMV